MAVFAEPSGLRHIFGLWREKLAAHSVTPNVALRGGFPTVRPAHTGSRRGLHPQGDAMKVTDR